jgi:hypothetical protein
VLFLLPTVKKIVYILLERMLIFPSVLCTNCTLGKIMHFSPSIYNILYYFIYFALLMPEISAAQAFIVD